MVNRAPGTVVFRRCISEARLSPTDRAVPIPWLNLYRPIPYRLHGTLQKLEDVNFTSRWNIDSPPRREIISEFTFGRLPILQTRGLVRAEKRLPAGIRSAPSTFWVSFKKFILTKLSLKSSPGNSRTEFGLHRNVPNIILTISHDWPDKCKISHRNNMSKLSSHIVLTMK
jgi:hypothetical protein